MPTADIRAVICASQYSSVVPVDADGVPTMNMLLWLDKRGATSRLRKLPGFPRGADSPLQLLTWLRVHGLPPVAAGISLVHLRFIKYARPEVYQRTAKFLEPTDFVTMRLTGRATTNQCSAFMYLLTDNRRLDAHEYDPRLLAYSTIDREKLPDLVPLDAIVGTVLPDVARELGLSPATPVVTGLNDTQAGGVGTAAFNGAHAAIAIGSTSVMITHVPFKRTDVRHGILSMPSPVPGTYFVMAENGTGAGALEHFLDKLVFPDDAFGAGGGADRYARLQRGVTRPQMIWPDTAHPAFTKAAHLFGIEVIVAPTHPETTHVDVDFVRDATSDRTVVIIGSAGNYPYGTIDPMAALSQVAVEKGVGLHVDGCLGGWILPWGQQLGYPDIPVFDFRLPGVTSISADTHKYGYGLKGTSVLALLLVPFRRFRHLPRQRFHEGARLAVQWPAESECDSHVRDGPADSARCRRQLRPRPRRGGGLCPEPAASRPAERRHLWWRRRRAG